MVIEQATQIGNPVIRTKAKAVSGISSSATKRIVRNLIDSMRYHGLVGMAAPQIGIGKRIFITEIRKTKSRDPKQLDPVRMFINPKITKRSRRQAYGYEGCGSVARAGLFGNVKRSYGVTVVACNEKGEKFRLEATDLLARIIQHEQDHLEGRVFLDRLVDMKSVKNREEYLKRK